MLAQVRGVGFARELTCTKIIRCYDIQVPEIIVKSRQL